jgi:hypothetical protein
LKELLNQFIIDYSHILNSEIVQKIKKSYFDCEYVINNGNEEKEIMKYYDTAKRVHENINNAIELMENDMNFDLTKFNEGIK